MFKQLIIGLDAANLMLAGELLFFAIFCASIFWVFRKGSNELYERLATMPNDGNLACLRHDNLGERQ